MLAVLWASIGGLKAQAYTESDLTDAGWSEVTTLDNATLSQYVYVFYAKEGTNLMLAQGKVTGYQENRLTGVYRTASDPVSETEMVWMLDYSDDYKYGLRSLSNPTLYMQSRGGSGVGSYNIQFQWEKAQSQWTRFNLAHADGYWTIENNASTYSNQFIGPWDENANDPSSVFADGKAVAGNKTGSYIGHFKLYRMTKALYNAQHYGKMYYPDFTAVTSTDQLTAEAMSANYYVIVAETNPNLAVTARNRTEDANVRLKYATQDVLHNTAQLWTLTANDGGFSLRNVKKNHGLLQAVNGNTPWYNAIFDIQEPSALTKFSFAADDVAGFTIENSYYPGNYLGLWTPRNGYKNNEVIAANKAGSEIGHFYVYAIARDAYKTLYMANNTEVTDLFMTNAHVENTYGWSGDNVGTYSNQQYTGASDNTFLDNSGRVANMHQQVTLPAGDYILKVATRAAINQNDAWIYILKLGEQDLDKGNFVKKGNTGNTLGNGWNWNFMTFSLDTETTVQIGFYKQNAAWAGADDFHLYKVDGMDVPESLIAELAANMQGEEVLMNTAEKAAQTTAQTDATDSKTFASLQAFVTAVRTAQNSADIYAAMKTRYLDVLTAQLENNNVYTTDAYNNIYAKFANGTATDEDAAAAVINKTKQTSTYDQLFMPSWKIGETAALSSNDFYFNTWSTEGNNDGTNFTTPFFEYFVGDNMVLAANTLTATQTGLEPNATYSVSAWVRVRQTNERTKIANGVTMRVGSGTVVDVSDGTQVGTSPFYINEYTAIGATDAQGTLTIRFTVAEGSNIHWLSFKNVKYTKEENGLDISEESTSPIVAGDYSVVTLCRTLQTGGYNTFAAPFDISSEKLTQLGITAKQLNSSSFANGTLTLNFANAANIEAGKPYLVKVSANVVNPTFENVTVNDAATTTTTDAVDFIPTLGVTTIEGDATSILFLGAGNKLYNPNNESSQIKGFRAYFKLKDVAATARTFRLDFGNGETTSIEHFPMNSQQSASVYTLDGRRIEGQPTEKGVYIVNGKKIVIK